MMFKKEKKATLRRETKKKVQTHTGGVAPTTHKREKKKTQAVN